VHLTGQAKRGEKNMATIPPKRKKTIRNFSF